MKLKIGSDIIKVYKDVHIWIGITCGLMLFIAFYAGAITMFEKPLERWATPPSALPACSTGRVCATPPGPRRSSTAGTGC